MLSSNTASNKIENRKSTWQSRDATRNRITSWDRETNTFGQQSGTQWNVLAIEATWTMTPLSSSNLSPYTSSTKATTNWFESSGMSFEKLHRTADSALIPSEQETRLMCWCALKIPIFVVHSHWKSYYTVNPLQYIMEQGEITATKIETHLPPKWERRWEQVISNAGELEKLSEDASQVEASCDDPHPNKD